MIRTRIAHRYARALFELAQEVGKIEEIGQDLDLLHQLLVSDATLRSSLMSPGLPRATKSKIVDLVVGAAGPHPLVANFLRVLLEARKFPLLPDILTAYRGMLDSALNRVRGEAVTAIGLEDTDVAALSRALSVALDKEVILEARTDPSILGGVVARVGNLVFDGSLRTQLQRMRETLIKG